MATKLQNGSSSSKVSFSWRLEYELQQLVNLLSEPMAITFQHFRRLPNSLVDTLENKGVLSHSFIQIFKLGEIPDNSFKEECLQIATKDHPPDVGDMNGYTKDRSVRDGVSMAMDIEAAQNGMEENQDDLDRATV